jgi:hypothetical protein
MLIVNIDHGGGQCPSDDRDHSGSTIFVVVTVCADERSVGQLERVAVSNLRVRAVVSAGP